MYSEYQKGLVLTLLGVIIFTPDTLLIRLTDLEFFSLTVGRGTIGGLAMFLGLALYYRRDFKKQILAIGGWGLVLAVLQGSFTWTFYGALMNTSVANVLVFFASMPLISALMSKMFLHEQVQKATWTAIGVVVLGLLIVGSRGLIVGNWLGAFLP
jgi:drug/metabolite transporter (DMT)-like permease